jgi:ribosomal protein L37AE/L43A
MEAAGREIWMEHTGREVSTEAFLEAYVIAGRRSGKSIISALVATFAAAFKSYDDTLSPGEQGTLMVVASDRRQARVIFNYIRAFFRTPMLKGLVVSELKESITLSNRVVIEIHTCSFKATRGYTLVGVIADEAAFWQSESSANPAAEVLNAVRPGLATTNGLLLVVSSPYGKTGVLYDNFWEHYGKSDSPILVWRGTSRQMNPTLPLRVVERALERDRAAASAEYLAIFRDDLSGFLSIEEIERVIVPGRTMLPCIGSQQYRGFCDPSGGRSDSMTLGIAHGEGERAILDLLREIKSPFSPEEAVREFAQVLKAYHISEITGDRYSAEWVKEAFERHGIRYVPSEKNRSELYLEFLPALTSGQIELLDNERMKQQFAGLQRRTSGAGRDAVDHGIGGHDDLSNCCAGAVCRVLEENATGTLGLLDLMKDIGLGKRLLPVLTRVDNVVLVKKEKPKCPICQKRELVIQAAVLGDWLCNQCQATFDGESKLTSEPRKEIIGVNCCAYPLRQTIANEVKCGNCAKQSGHRPQDPKPLGISRKQYFARGFAIRTDNSFRRNSFGRFG